MYTVVHSMQHRVKILALVSPYSEKPKVRYVSEFNLGYFT